MTLYVIEEECTDSDATDRDRVSKSWWRPMDGYHPFTTLESASLMLRNIKARFRDSEFHTHIRLTRYERSRICEFGGTR